MMRSDALKKRILDAAMEILSRDGYPALSMRKIAARIDYSPGIIYHYFKDKSEVVAGILARGYGRILSLIKGAVIDPKDPRGTLLGLFTAYTEMALRNANEFRVMLLGNPGRASAGLRMLSRGASHRRESLAGLAGVVRAYIQSGVFRPVDVEIAAQTIWAAMYGLVARFLIEEDVTRARRKALLESLADALVTGLGS